MLFTFASTLAFSDLIAASPGISGPGFVTPSTRPPTRAPVRPVANPLEPAAPTVPRLPVLADPAEVEPTAGAPDELAVPTALVPGAVGTLLAFPAPLGSFTELFNPPALAGPLGTPLMPEVPAPADPAFGVPTGLADPAVGPLAAPVAEAPPDAPPPAPPELPPPLCAWAATGPISAIIMMNLRGSNFRIGTPVELLHSGNSGPVRLFPSAAGRSPTPHRLGTRSRPSISDRPVPSPRPAWRPADVRRNRQCGAG